MKKWVLHPEPLCFGCGKDNPHGLQVETEVFEDKVIGILKIKNFFKGFGKISHGGPLMSALDEVMSYIPLLKKDGVYLTQKITFRFIKGVRIGSEVLIEAREKKKDKRTCIVKGTMKDRKGNIYIEAEGIFKKIEENKIREYS